MWGGSLIWGVSKLHFWNESLSVCHSNGISNFSTYIYSWGRVIKFRVWLLCKLPMLCHHYSILDIKGEQRQWKWDCCPNEFTAVWWDCHYWNMVSLFFFSLGAFHVSKIKCASIQYFVVLPVFCHIRSDKSNTDVTLAPFSLPLSVIRR